MAASATNTMVTLRRPSPITLNASSPNSRHCFAFIFRCRWRLMTSIMGKCQTLHLGLLRMRLVGLDNHLHQFVADDVFVAEVNKVYSFDTRQHTFGLDQAAAFAGRQIDLSHVTGDDGLRAKPDTREKHF